MAPRTELIPLEEIVAWLKTVSLMNLAREVDLTYQTLRNVREGRGVHYKTVVVLSRHINRQRSNGRKTAV
jgi:lambda repressor-like predicted transcriptional regulator